MAIQEDRQSAGIRVVLADRKSLFREAVRVTLEREEGLEVVSVAGDVTETLAEVKRHRPQVVVLSDTLGQPDATEVVTLIKESKPESRVLFLARGGDCATLVEALRAGVSGYVTEDCVLDELITATYAVARGETFLAQQMVAPLIEELTEGRQRRQDAVRMVSRLTKREREVLSLVAAGGDNETLAQTLVIGRQTARTHVQNILSKLGLHSRAALEMFARQQTVADALATLGQPAARGPDEDTLRKEAARPEVSLGARAGWDSTG